MAAPAAFQPLTPTPPRAPRTGSYALPSAPASHQPMSLGDFEVIDKIGQGGMGAVYRARQVSLERVVALKILPRLFEEDEDYVARFQREAALAARLNHPNLVRVYSSGQIDACHYIAMEFIDGENLRQRMKREPVSMSEALRICADVARALQCGWDSAHLIHRDIKPANIYLSHGGEVKLGDLGLAKSALANTTGITQTGTSLGTPLYMSPEQGRGDKQIDFRSDIYSLGCTLFELLTGKPPYEGRDGHTLIHQHIHAPLPAILKVLPGCPIALVRLVGKMLKKNPRERHSDYTDLIAEMEWVREQLEFPATALSSVPLIATRRQSGQIAPPTQTTPASGQVVHPPSTNPNTYASAPNRSALRGVAVAAGALMVGVIAVLALKPKPPAARIISKASPAEVGASPKAPTPDPTRADTSIVLPPLPAAVEARAVKLWDSPDKLPKAKGIRWEDDAMRLDGASTISGPDSRDAILRATVRTNPGGSAVLNLRKQAEGGFDKSCQLVLEGKANQVVLRTATSGNFIGVWPLPPASTADRWLRIELRAIGDDFTAIIDGKIIGTAHSEALRHPGKAMLYAGSNGYFRDIEYIPLDSLPEPPR